MCNNRAAEFWGDTSEEIVGRPFTDFIHPDSLADVTDRYYRRIGGEKIPSMYETILRRKDGSRFYAEVNASVISFDGKPADFIIIRDMNDRKKSAEVLQKSEDNYRTLAEASTDLIFVIDRDDRVEYVNSYASAFVSEPVDQIIGGPRSALFPPEVAGNQKKALEKVFGTGVPFRNETLLTFAGREHWFDHSLIPLKDADNYVRSVLGISRDITKQKNTEKKLRDSEQLYQRLLEQSFDAIAIHKDRKIAYINKRATEILGAASPDELIGRPIFDLIHPDSRRVLEDRLEKLNADPGIPVPITTERFFRVNGTTVPVEVMAIRFDDNGTPAIRVVFREIASHPDRENVSKKRGAGSK
jgi:PAS domain S-box-containing protein